MFEGIVTVKQYAAQLINNVWEPVHLLSEVTKHNSITANGVINLVNGRMFSDGLPPVIHVYDHFEQISPAVAVVSGYIDTCTMIGSPARVEDAAQQYVLKSVVGRLDPTGSPRTIRTVGLGAAADTDTPSFAVRLTNPVTQGADQLIEITYTIVARKVNNTTPAQIGGTVSKVTNNAWSALFDRLYGETPALPAATYNDVSFLAAPDDYVIGDTAGTENSLAEVIGLDEANRLALATVTANVPTVVTYGDEGSVQISIAVGDDDGIGRNFNKTLVSVAGGPHLYINDLGNGIATAQGIYQHPAPATSADATPYASLAVGPGVGTGSMEVTTPPSAEVKFPVYVAAIITPLEAGGFGYTLATRFTQGFINNDPLTEAPYRLPALDIMDTGAPINEYDEGVAFTGRAVLNSATTDPANGFPLNVISLRQSTTSGSDYIGENGQSDAIAFLSPTGMYVTTNLGTATYSIDEQHFPTFTPSLIRSAANVVVSGLARTFLADALTGLWRINEIPAGEQYSPGVPFQVIVPIVDSTACYAVASRNIAGDPVLFAVFEGGLVRSVNGGTSWQVYGDLAGSLPFNGGSAITADWDSVSAIIPGPTNISTGESTIALILTDDTIAWVDLTNTEATLVDTETLVGVSVLASAPAFAVQARNSYFRTPISAGSPASQVWVMATETDIRFYEYTPGTGVTGTTVPSVDLTTMLVPARLFTGPLEYFDGPEESSYMLMIDNAASRVVLVDDTATVVHTIPSDDPALLTHLMTASCKPYRHFLFSALPSPVLFNPTPGHLIDTNWRFYQWTGTEWQRRTDVVWSDMIGPPYIVPAAPIHLFPETIFSTGPNGILQDLPPGMELTFATNDGTTPWVSGEFFSFTVTSGIQKDEYTSFTHTAVHNFYRAVPVADGTVTLMTGADFVGKPLNFNTRPHDTAWFSQLGVLSSINDATERLIRSEVVTPAAGQPFTVSFKVTRAASTGTFAVGIALETLPTTVVGPETLATSLPLRIEFSGTQFQVLRDTDPVTALASIPDGAEFTIYTDGSVFEVRLNGATLPPLTSTLLPSAYTGNRLAIGAYAVNNENRYAYDMRIDAWPASFGTVAYYKVLDGANDITSDPLFIGIESRTVPLSARLAGVDETVTLYADAGQVFSGSDQVKLLPKTGIVMANDVDSIGTALLSCVTLKK